jgi:periplasmic protein CpxP/Spy
MKKVAVLFVLLFAFVANTFAQTDAVAAPLKSEKMSKSDRKAKAKQAADDLGLSADQKAKMKEIGQSLKGKMKAIKSDASLTKDQKKVQTGEVAKQHEADIKAILSPEQFTKWDAMAKERRAKMKELRGKKGGKKGVDDGENR